MIDLRQHEQFELEVLKKFSDHSFLSKLIFGGGTALRLCYGLNRYSVDLDFWSKPSFKKPDFETLRRVLSESYTITDHKEKYFTYLLEIRSAQRRRKIKIEIRKKLPKNVETELSIAFSPFSTLQVQIFTFTLRQMWKNKLQALLERKEIRDAYDLEFIYKSGAANMIELTKKERHTFFAILDGFTLQDYKVTLGSLLETDERKYYIQSGFKILKYALSRL